MDKIEFTCPRCNGHKLEEVMVDVTVVSDMTNISVENGVANCEYGEQTNEDGEVYCYQCAECGDVLEYNGLIVDDMEALARWFALNG